MVKRTLIFVMGAALVGGMARGAEVSLTAANLPPGTIVRIAAKRPAITLSRAQVVECTNRSLTVIHKRELFRVAEPNLLDLVVLERPEPADEVTAAGGESDSSSDSPRSRKRPKTLWQRLLSLWK